jgi:hypothetical protein
MVRRSEGKRGVRLSAVSVVLAAAFLAATAVDAYAEAATTCVKATKVTPPKPAKAHYTGGYSDKGCTEVNATHEGKYEKLADLSAEQESKIAALLEHVKVEEKGIDEKPTIQFTGANVQIVDGEGKTETTNGMGNLIVGYDESPGTQTGSHNLVLGSHQTFTSFGAVLGGIDDTASGPFSDVFGMENVASGGHGASVTGGRKNTASGEDGASVSGGEENTASGEYANSVSGGKGNTAAGEYANAVTGGEDNKAGAGSTLDNGAESVTGGYENTASGEEPGHAVGVAISGGARNIAYYFSDSISGGTENVVAEGQASVSGGWKNVIPYEGGEAAYASITGGEENKAVGLSASVTGGLKNIAGSNCCGAWDSISGGQENSATGSYSSIAGGYQNQAEAGSFVGGGYRNHASMYLSFIGGGYEVKAQGSYSAILGGKLEEVTKEFEAKL